jgi:hypothetical protein
MLRAADEIVFFGRNFVGKNIHFVLKDILKILETQFKILQNCFRKP